MLPQRDCTDRVAVDQSSLSIGSELLKPCTVMYISVARLEQKQGIYATDHFGEVALYSLRMKNGKSLFEYNKDNL